jgi:hypothetical protein
MTDNQHTCHNCAGQLSVTDSYCRQCGQPADTNLLSFKELIYSFWNSLFNLDNTLFKTLRYIWAPWMLTAFYVEGKRKSFLNPMRLFIITLLFHFGYLVSLTNNNINTLNSNGEYQLLEKSLIYENYLTVKNKFSEDNNVKTFTDSLENTIFKNTRVPAIDTFKIENIFNLNEFPITRKDAIQLPIDSIYSKYHITSFFDKLKVKQMIRLNLDRAGMVRFAIGNAAWGVFVVIGFLAGIFKLLYFRKKMHYAEHLVLLMNLHSFCFLINTIILFIYYILLHSGSHDGIIGVALSLFAPLYLFITMKIYYRQGFFKTFIKYLITSGVYLVLGIFIILMVSIGSLIFF